MYEIHDTFNDRVISRHRTLEKAVREDVKFRRMVQRNNPPGSYIPTVIRRDGEPLSEEKLEEVMVMERDL